MVFTDTASRIIEAVPKKAERRSAISEARSGWSTVGQIGITYRRPIGLFSVFLVPIGGLESAVGETINPAFC
jgi:hypothetical protein